MQHATISIYLISWVLPFSMDSGKTTNLDKLKPVGKLIQNAIKNAAIGALMVTIGKFRSFSCKMK